MTLSFISHSGARAGQPNAHELVGPSARVLLDCGAAGGDGGYVDELQRPSVVWISHAHRDHAGAVLELLSRWPRLVVVATATTAKLLRFALGAGGAREAARVDAACRRIKTLGWRRFEPIPRCDGVRMMALRAGHVSGSAMVVVEINGGSRRRTVLYTGDFCTHDQAVVSGGGIPRKKGGFSVDALISEAMLANDRKANDVVWSDEADRLAEAARKTSGPLLAGVEAIGESLEVTATLIRAGVSVMVDEYLRPVFEACSHQLEQVFSEISFGDRRRLRGCLRADGVVVACGTQYRSSTTAARLADELIDDPSATIAVFNRARSRTPAGRLLASKPGREIRWRGRSICRRTDVVYCRMINHAPRWQLRGFIAGLDADTTFLVHGPTGSRWGLKRALDKDGFGGSVEVVERGERYDW